MVSCSLGEATKDLMASYYQETNAIYETSRYSQYILYEVLHTKTMVK